MKTLTIVDGNNFFRRRIETDILGQPVSNCFRELHYKPDTVVICVWDGYNGNAKRRELYPDYKAHRTFAGEDIFKSQDLLKKVLKFSRVIQVQVDGYEGDDVIAMLVDKYRGQFDRIFIESNDVDLRQLGCLMAKDTFPEAPEYIKIYKTIVGDSSDNIKGAKGFGKGTWAKLTTQQKNIIEHVVVSGWAMLPEEVEAEVKDFFPKGALKWFIQKENRETLQLYYKIIGFMYIEWPVIQENMIVGINRPELAEPIFKEFML